MYDVDFDRHFRLLICGGKGVGKSSLLSCFAFHGGRSEGTTTLRLDDVNIRIDVLKKDEWRQEYVSQFDAIVIVFAADDYKSFEHALEVVRSVQSYDFLPVVVVENKVDLIDNYNFSRNLLIENTLRQARICLYRVCAEHDFNVMHPFAYVLEKLLRFCDENANVPERPFRKSRPLWKDLLRWPVMSPQKKSASCAVM